MSQTVFDENRGMYSSVAIRFCEECKNMLYPKAFQEEDELENSTLKLTYQCRICSRTEEVEGVDNAKTPITSQGCDEEADNLLIPEDFPTDPTLKKDKEAVCFKCGGMDVVFYHNDNASTIHRMEYVYFCKNEECNYLWIPQNPKTPKPQNPKTPKPQNLKTPKPQNPLKFEVG